MPNDEGALVERLRRHAPFLKASVFIDAALAIEDAADAIDKLAAAGEIDNAG